MKLEKDKVQTLFYSWFDSLITLRWDMDKVELFVIVIYIAVITSTWMKNRMAIQSYISIYNKKVC